MSAPLKTNQPLTQSCLKQHFSECGTGLANIDRYKSYDAKPAYPTRNSNWGGKRNTRDRQSDYLSLAQCKGILAALSHASVIGLTFSRHWSIHTERAGIKNGEFTARFVRDLLKRIGEYVRRRNGTFAAIWVREDAPTKGSHVHIMLAIPDGLKLAHYPRRWVKACGGISRKGVSRMTRVGGTLASTISNDDRHSANVQRVGKYLLKAATPEAGKYLNLTVFGQGGRIQGKRCGWTQNIGAKAQKAFQEAKSAIGGN